MDTLKKIRKIIETRGHWFVLFGMIMWSAYLITQFTRADLMVVLDKLVVDDAFYYFSIAKHVTSGEGFTFDGLSRTNGFQPLWQLLMLPIFAIFKDPVADVRAVIALGGTLHILSGLLLYTIINRIWGRGWALLVAYFWLLNKNILNINLSGMESPLFAITFLALVSFLIKYLDRIPNTRTVLLLGVMTALVSLSRVEASIVFFFVAFLLIVELRKELSPLKKMLSCLSIFVAGFLLLFGPYLIWNISYFKTLLPVSGQVKFFYEFGAGWAPIHQPALFVVETLKNIVMFSGHVIDIAFGTFSHYLGSFLYHELGITIEVRHLTWIYGISFIAAIVTETLGKRDFDIPIAYKRVVLTLVFFCFIHFLFISVLLPHFATYNTWYYPAILILIISLGVLTLRLVVNKLGKFRLLPVLLLVCALIFAQKSLYNNIKNETSELPKGNNSYKVRFYEATRWMNENLKDGSIIGSFSAGIVGFFSNHRVVNLDGFANSKDYLDCLKKGKMREYVEEMGITYLSDYFSQDPSKEGIDWCGRLRGEEISILMKWPLPEGVSYMILRYERKE